MIIVTGGAGFIGSAIVWRLNKEGYDKIIIVDNLGNTDKWKNLVKLKFYDIIHKDDFLKLIEKGIFDKDVEGIIHLGACTDTTEKNANYLLRNNYEYSKSLLKWAISKNKRFIYASSAATYGDGKNDFVDEESKIPSLKPLNMYAYSKQLFDLWVLKQGLFDKVAGIKYFNVYGPNEYHKGEMASVVYKSFLQIKNFGKVRLFKSYNPKYKDGWQMRDFVYVKDVVDLTLFIYKNKKVNGIFNAGTGKARSFYELVSIIFKILGKKEKIKYIDMPSDIKDKYQYFTEAKMDKIKKIGYKRKFFSLEEGIRDYLENYLLTSDPYLGKDKEKI